MAGFRIEADSVTDAVRMLVEQFLASRPHISQLKNWNTLPDGSKYRITITRASNLARSAGKKTKRRA